MIGHVFSRYRILGQLGEGATGVVYVAEDVSLGRRVAIKFLHPSARSKENGNYYRTRFLREARTLSFLNHPNIAAVYDYGETQDGQPYIVMELVTGSTLKDILITTGLNLHRAIEIITDVAAALAEAHRRGVIHRDIKPSNVLINDRGEVKVLDFGLAKLLEEEYKLEADLATQTLTRSDIVIGTPLYLSPEQARGTRVDGRSDIFALGSMLYECIAGRPAFSGSNVIEIGAQVLHFDPPRPSRINPLVPPELDYIAMKALAKRPEDRYQSAEEIITELLDVQTNLSNDDRPTRRLKDHTRNQFSIASTLSDILRRPRLSIFSLLTVAVGIIVTAAVITDLLPRSGQTNLPASDVLVALIKFIAPISLVILFFALVVSSLNIGFGSIRAAMRKWRFLEAGKSYERAMQTHSVTAPVGRINNVITFFEAAGYKVSSQKQSDFQVTPHLPSDNDRYGSSLVRFFDVLPTIEEIQTFCKEALQASGSPASGYRPAFLVCPYLEPTHQLQAAVYKDMRLAVVPITYDWIMETNAQGEQRNNLLNVLDAFVGREDPFRYSIPVSVPGDFYGRKDVAAALVRDLDRGQSVGLFGMRKIGKTSLIQHTLRTRTGPVLYIDCQGLTHPRTILRRLPQELRRALKRLMPKIQWPEFKEKDSDLETLADAVGRYLQDIYSLYVARSQSADRITLVLDEVDRIVPNTAGRGGSIEEYETLFGLIRSLGQGVERILVCMVAGFSADITQKDVGLSQSAAGNPVFSFFNIHRLEPMSASDIALMMNGLGSRARLQFTKAGSFRLYQWSGGHPFLARLMGSVIHLNTDKYKLKLADTAAGDAFEVDESIVNRAADDLLEDVTSRSPVAQVLERFSDPLYMSVFTRLAHAGSEGCTREALLSIASHAKSERNIKDVLNSLEVASLVQNVNGRFRLFAILLEALIMRGYV